MQRPRTGGDRTAPRVALGASVASFVFVALVAATPGSPFTPILPSEPGGPFRWLAELVGLDGVHGSALAAIGVVAVSFAAVAFVLVLRECRRGTISARTAIGLAIAYHVALAVPAAPVLARRLFVRVLREDRRHVPREPVRRDARRLPARRPRDLRRSEVGRHAGGLRRAVDADLGARDARHRRRRHGRLDVPGDRDRREPRDRLRRGGPRPRVRPEREAFAVALVGLNPRGAVPERGQRAQRPAGGARGRGRPRARLLGARAVGDGRARARDARQGDGRGAAPAVVGRGRGPATAGRTRPDPRYRTWSLAAALALVAAAPFANTDDPTLGAVELGSHEGWLAPSRFFRPRRSTRSRATCSGSCRGSRSRSWRSSRSSWWRGPSGAGDPRVGSALVGASWGWGLLCLMLLGPVLLPWYVTWALPLGWLLPRVPRTVLIGTGLALTVSQWTSEPAAVRLGVRREPAGRALRDHAGRDRATRLAAPGPVAPNPIRRAARGRTGRGTRRRRRALRRRAPRQLVPSGTPSVSSAVADEDQHRGADRRGSRHGRDRVGEPDPRPAVADHREQGQHDQMRPTRSPRPTRVRVGRSARRPSPAAKDR